MSAHFHSPLDQPIPVTFFQNYAASHKREEQCTLRMLTEQIRRTTAKIKTELPWLKLAKFGDRRTGMNSLRSDENVVAISGIEADYDGEEMSFDTAQELLEQRAIAACIYTSPSHTEDAPRWRVICPLSEELPPEKRQHMLGRLNGLFGGIFSGESWTLSQSYYFGSVNRNPAHRVELIDGLPIDLHDDLDEAWIGKPQTQSTGNGANGPQSGPIDVDALLQEIKEGKNYHAAIIRLAGYYAVNGKSYIEVRKIMRDAMEMVFPPDRDKRWHSRYADIDRTLQYVFGKESAKPQQEERDSSKGNGSGAAKGDNEAPRVPHIVNPTALEKQRLPERRWIVEGWLPVRVCTGNYGDGGVGKTLLAQQLQTACATGIPWCGLETLQCKSFALYCEDSEEELHIRQNDINNIFGRSYSELRDMRWISGVGDDWTLVNFTSDGRMHTTPKWDFLVREIKAFGAQIIPLDTATDLFGGNENDRGQVRRFINLLAGLAREINGAVLLNAHPSRDGLRSGNLDGGSTAWSNTFRSRWSLARGDSDANTQPDTRPCGRFCGGEI